MRTLSLTILFLAAALAGCTPAARRGEDVAQDRAVVEVQNQRLQDVNVFVLNGGQRIRLGRVGPSRTASFTIPSGVVQSPREVEFLAESIGGGAPAISRIIWVAPGDRVRLLLTP